MGGSIKRDWEEEYRALVRLLGGGVKPNKSKIGIRAAAYKGQRCNADMHFWVAKKETAPQRSSALGRYSLLQVRGTITVLVEKATP